MAERMGLDIALSLLSGPLSLLLFGREGLCGMVKEQYAGTTGLM